MTISR